MLADKNKAIVHRLIEEVWNQGKIDVTDELFTKSSVMQDPTFGERVFGAESFKDLVAMHRAAFPDLHITINDESADDESVTLRFTLSGNHVGRFRQVQPTGVQVTLTGKRIYTIVEGKIAAIEEAESGKRKAETGEQ